MTGKIERETEEAEHELGSIVVAHTSSTPSRMPWYIVLRQWIFCFFFLICAELGARLYYDTGISLQTERFDNFPTPAIENVFVAQMRRDTAFKIAVVGDSTVVGAALLDPKDSVPHQLEVALRGVLPNRDIHVWNFGVAGARAADLLCIYKKVEEGHPDLVIVGGSYYITAMGITKDPIAEPWLAYNLSSIPDTIVPLLQRKEPKQQWEENLTNLVEANFRLLGMRQALNAHLFGIQPRYPYNIANPFVMIGATAGKKLHKLYAKPYNERGRDYSPQHYIAFYVKDITPDDLNGRYYQYLMQEIQRSGVRGMTYLTPQNPAMTSLTLTPTTYLKRRKILSGFLEVPGCIHRDYCDLIPKELFTDNDHLLPEGNQILADAIAKEISPVIRQIASKSP